MFSRIQLAVVGHPNKGKSSIVATLAENDSVVIGPRSGTTTRNQRLKVNTGRAGYELIDTPGFQRPQKVLQWLQKHAGSAADRKHAIEKMLADDECRHRFAEECELLTPISKGAAILYVVDGSRPYGPEYEAEMEILRWSGAPSIALINPISGEQYIEQWQRALGQYFKLVRVFNPMQSGISKTLELLRALSTLEPRWQALLEQIGEDIQERLLWRQQSAASLLARWLVQACQYSLSEEFADKNEAEAQKDRLIDLYVSQLEAAEQKVFAELIKIYNFSRIDLRHHAVTIPEDLFVTDKWYLWGLNRKQLALAGAVAGAGAGASIDVFTAGHTLLIGSVIGGAVGATSAYLGADKLHNLQLEKLTTGGYSARVGPCRNLNFAYVLVGRFVHLYHQLGGLTHARRQVTLEVQPRPLAEWLDKLDAEPSKMLKQSLNNLVKQKAAPELAGALSALLETVSDQAKQ